MTIAVSDECEQIMDLMMMVGRHSGSNASIYRLAEICREQQRLIDRLLAVTPMAQERHE